MEHANINVGGTSGTNQSFLDTARKQLSKAGEKSSKIFGFVVLNSALGGIPGIMLTKAHLANLKSMKDASPRNTNVVSGMVTTVKQKSQTDKAINDSPQCRHKPEKMMEYLCARHGTEKVRAVMERAVKDDCRFNNSDKARFNFDKTELENALSDIEEKQAGKSSKKDNTLYVPDLEQEDLTNVQEGPVKQVSYSKSIEKDIKDELVAFVERKEIQVGVKDNIGQEVGVVKQNAGHMDYKMDANGKRIGNFHEKTTPSAELSNAKKMGNVTNQASVTYVDNTTQKEEVLMCRSGRTDTPEKIRDKSAGDIVARAMASKGQGDDCLKPVKDDNGNVLHFEYRRTDTTLMDTALLKSGYTLATGAFFNLGKETPLEAERMFVENKKKAVKNTWDESKCLRDANFRPFILHELKVDVGNGPELITVREYKPLVFQFVFSSQSKSTDNLVAARKANLPSTLELGRLFAEKSKSDASSIKDGSLAKSIKNYQDNPNSTNMQALQVKIIECRQDLLINILPSNPDNPEETRNLYALEGLHAMLTGKNMQNESIDTVEGTGQQFLYASILSEIAGVAIGAECKSGNDRTIAAVSLLSASKEWEKTRGEPLNPAEVKGENEGFKKIFTKYMIMLGEPNVMASRGVAEGDVKPVLKTKTHPLAQMLTTHDGANVEADMLVTGGARYGKKTCCLNTAVKQT